MGRVLPKKKRGRKGLTFGGGETEDGGTLRKATRGQRAARNGDQRRLGANRNHDTGHVREWGERASVWKKRRSRETAQGESLGKKKPRRGREAGAKGRGATTSKKRERNRESSSFEVDIGATRPAQAKGKKSWGPAGETDESLTKTKGEGKKRCSSVVSKG